ncbi:monooxygenase [Elsinoe ampelina]|uniref:Monooxygenase n=1 Tax=Elsinoe ampelina TaxID=302913 RepID=A0A6A6GBI3_9PEZI|nr:monooxygenase [Elsinoe ampelina]
MLPTLAIVIMHLFLHMLLSHLALAASVPRGEASTCSNPTIRREWRQLSPVEQQNYIDAVLCLKTKPSRIGLNSSLYDDFPYVHNQLNLEIHFVASFLPWHRYFVHIYETALKTECGYSGSAVYWDWTLDVASVPSSPVFSPTSGFGGDGSWNKTVRVDQFSLRRCVVDGPFADITNEYFGDSRTPHCLMRSFNNGTEQVGDMFSPNYTPQKIEEIQQLPDYDAYRRKLEGTPHGAIHSSLGGDMIPSTSPNDPLFFLHHTQIDCLWWLWQTEKPERFAEYAGIRTQDQFNGVTPPAASKTDLMKMGGLAEDATVEEYLTSSKNGMCYGY